jgi:hypothetical protein
MSSAYIGTYNQENLILLAELEDHDAYAPGLMPADNGLMRVAYHLSNLAATSLKLASDPDQPYGQATKSVAKTCETATLAFLKDITDQNIRMTWRKACLGLLIHLTQHCEEEVIESFVRIPEDGVYPEEVWRHMEASAKPEPENDEDPSPPALEMD